MCVMMNEIQTIEVVRKDIPSLEGTKLKKNVLPSKWRTFFDHHLWSIFLSYFAKQSHILPTCGRRLKEQTLRGTTVSMQYLFIIVLSGSRTWGPQGCLMIEQYRACLRPLSHHHRVTFLTINLIKSNKIINIAVVIFDSKLQWADHIAHALKRSMKAPNAI